MNNEFKRLPDAELDIMNYIWEQNKAVSSADILEGLKNRRKWTLATVLNLLARLSDKGFVESEKQGKFKMYSHIVNRDEYLSQESKTILDHVYNGSVSRMISALCDSTDLTQDDILSLKAFIDEKTKE
ncbi:MAG: BlaI/MecI/CopY family transcriptional regulator [Porcipelethomonas sp.]